MEEFTRSDLVPTLGDSGKVTLLKAADINFDDFETKLNLACGHDYIEGFVNLDGDETTKADVYCQLDLADVKLPFEDGHFDFIYASHILEHIWYLPQLKLELIRILRTGGKMLVIVPHFLSVDAWGDDTHCRAFSPGSFYPLFWPGCTINRYLEFSIDPKDQRIMERKWITGVIEKTS